MTRYNVHIYREMRLTFSGIDADTPETAAALAHGKPTGDSDDIDDCDGEDFAALVDVAGDEDYAQSVTIDFEAERQRKAAPKLRAALEAILPYAESENASLVECWNRDGEPAAQAEAEWCGKAIAQATAAIAEANAAGIATAPGEIDIHALLAGRRQIAVIWSVEDVREVAPNLTDDQCWEVLQEAERRHDAEIGINWNVLSCHADAVFGDVPDGAEPEEA